MKAPESTPSTTDVRKAARRYADGEADATVTSWPSYTPGERNGLRSMLMDFIGLPREHRNRRYFKDLMEVAMTAYDLRMEARQRSRLRREGR